MMSDRQKRVRARSPGPRKRHDGPPVGYARGWRARAPERIETLLQSKGFAGGVPPNTETAAVKPRVGIAR